MIFTFACTMKWEGWEDTHPERWINARTSGQAKSQYFRDIKELGYYRAGDPDQVAKYTDVKCRKVGLASTSREFERMAKYRGLPDWVKCGTRVRVSGELGYIVGHNDSSNLNVLFDDDSKYLGQVLNCHPGYQVEFIQEEECQVSPTSSNRSMSL